MLEGRDPETGEGLSDENIRYQMVTFLIAGHKTTSGLLSFALYLLLKNPKVLEKARGIVDEVLGGERPQVEDLSKLRYVEQILQESLRLWPTAPAFALAPKEPTTLAGRYPVTPEDTLFVLTPMLHRDPAVWDEPEAFRPERFAPETAQTLPPNAWKPFGNGMRSCIGRGFALQEAQLVLSMILQRFDLTMADPGYKLEVAETLTLNLDDLVAGMNALVDNDRLSLDGIRAEIVARDRETANPFCKDAQVMGIRNARKSLGDKLVRTAKSHELLDPAHGPLIAVRLNILTRKTLGGFETDLDGRVFGQNGAIMPGLYAAGEASGFGGGGVHGYRSLEGTFLGGCLFSGRQAGRAAARAA